LRSTRSLIQTIGRAARNVRGKVILYADRITDSMKTAMDETDRRRIKQKAYNTEHGITPTTVVKTVADILEGATSLSGKSRANKGGASEQETNILTPTELAKKIKSLEQEMYECAKNLEFEKAARIRDMLHHLVLPVG
jgi:excinuclease ABC subunit B